MHTKRRANYNTRGALYFIIGRLKCVHKRLSAVWRALQPPEKLLALRRILYHAKDVHDVAVKVVVYLHGAAGFAQNDVSPASKKVYKRPMGREMLHIPWREPPLAAVVAQRRHAWRFIGVHGFLQSKMGRGAADAPPQARW
jgi:hypothetical protein